MSKYFQEGELNNQGEYSSNPDNIFTKISVYYEALSDKLKNYFYERWAVIAILLLFFIVRLIITRGNNKTT